MGKGGKRVKTYFMDIHGNTTTGTKLSEVRKKMEMDNMQQLWVISKTERKKISARKRKKNFTFLILVL